MENKETNLLEWVAKFEDHKFAAPDTSCQIEAGWYDWFCKDESLYKKTKTLGTKVKQIVNSPKLNPTNQYVFFKNNCPCDGPLYDSFSICDIESGDVIFWITPKSGHTGMAEVCGPSNDFKEPLVPGTWKDIKDFFK